jgi:hypothetical protein
MKSNSYWILFATLFWLSTNTFGQHCEYDYTSVLLIEVIDYKTHDPVHGLEIQLVDSLGTDQGAVFGEVGEEGDGDKFYRKFPFANGSYMSILNDEHQHVTPLYLKISYNKSVSFDNNYLTTVIPLDRSHIVSLCKGTEVWNSDKFVRKAKVYVKLARERN